MAVIAPLRGLRYNPALVSRLEEVVTPPYDVIDAKAQALLLGKNPYNMIKLDLGKNSGSRENDDRYQQARHTFEQWQSEDVLRRDELPTVYLYYIDYVHPSGRRLTRKGLVSLVGLADFHEGVVKPHERTFSKVTDDRLRLLDTCQAQFSNVFSLYPDPECAIINALEPARGERPLGTAVDQDGCRHTLWAVTAPAAIKAVQTLFRDKALYIADGHHRYTTALRYRELMRERLGELPPDSPYNFIMMYLCGMEDPGLSILPTHRLVRLEAGVSAARLVDALAAGFIVEEMTGGNREILLAEVLARMDENVGAATMLGLYYPGEDRCFSLRLRPGVMDGNFAAELAPELRQLDVVVLSELALDRLLGMNQKRCEEEKRLDYFSDPDEALDVAVKEAGTTEKTPVLFLMNSTRVSQVREVADAGLVMPHKSTYFYPKILTGMIMNKLVPGEAVPQP